jgi:hypothetical protein
VPSLRKETGFIRVLQSEKVDAKSKYANLWSENCRQSVANGEKPKGNDRGKYYMAKVQNSDSETQCEEKFPGFFPPAQ